jgi:hypothetical protein
MGLLSLIAVLHVFTRLRLRRAIRDADTLLVRVLDHATSNGFVRDHIQLKNAILDSLTPTSPETALAALTPRVAPHLDRMCRQMAAMFEDITGRKCHCTIKTFNKNNNMVSTKARDDLPHNSARRVIDEHKVEFHYRENTAFKEILENSSAGWYVGNDLQTLRRNGQYENSNANWDKQYNATVVVPITYSMSPQTMDREHCSGFITVDSMAGVFEEKVSCAVLMQYSAILYDFLSLLGKQEP